MGLGGDYILNVDTLQTVFIYNIFIFVNFDMNCVKL